MIKTAAILLLVTMLLPSVLAQNVCIYFFYGATCPHCAEEKPFLHELKDRYPIELHEFEVYYNKTNAALWEKISSAYGTKPIAVPATFIGDIVFVGFVNGNGSAYNPNYNAYIGYSKGIERVVAEYAAKGGAKCPQVTLTPLENSSQHLSIYILVGIALAALAIVSILLKYKIKVRVHV